MRVCWSRPGGVRVGPEGRSSLALAPALSRIPAPGRLSQSTDNKAAD